MKLLVNVLILLVSTTLSYSQAKFRFSIYKEAEDSLYTKKFIEQSQLFLLIENREVELFNVGELLFLVSDIKTGEEKYLVLKFHNNCKCFISVIPNFYKFYSYRNGEPSVNIGIKKSIIVKRKFKSFVVRNSVPFYYRRNLRTIRKYLNNTIGIVFNYPAEYKMATMAPEIYHCDDYYYLYKLLGNKSPFDVDYDIQK